MAFGYCSSTEMRWRVLLLVAVVTLVTVGAGCHMNEPTWTLGMNVTVELETDDGVEIHTPVGCGGNPDEGSAVTDERVYVIDEARTKPFRRLERTDPSSVSSPVES